MATHSFNTKVAQECGVNAAIILHSILFWWEYKYVNHQDEHDGKSWVYNSKSSWAKLFPYFTERQVRTALDKLRECEYVETGNFNKEKWDKTLWYTPTKKGICIGLECPTPSDFEVQSTSDFNVRPIPDISTNSISTNNSISTDTPSAKNGRCRSSQEAKETYLDFVKLTKAEYEKLVLKHGQECVDWKIEVLNQYIGERNGKYDKNHYYVLNGGWAHKRWVEEHGTKKGDANGNFRKTITENSGGPAFKCGEFV